jgi:hypothetical protein
VTNSYGSVVLNALRVSGGRPGGGS